MRSNVLRLLTDIERATAAIHAPTPCDSPEAWLAFYFKCQRITYDYKTDSIIQDGERIEERLVLSKLRLVTLSTGMKRFSSYIKDAFRIWRHEEERNALVRLRDSFRFVAIDTDLVAEWVSAATGSQDPLDVAVMRHFVWQVKRKIYGLPVEHHMMPVLFGKSGGGKSVAAYKLIEPLTDFALTADMSIFHDHFGRPQFARNFIMFFDELEGAGDADVNRIKQVITAPVVEWRAMRSESVQSAPQNCTFIGCTNDPVRERIKDPTSSRRFWQLNCAQRLEWDAINKIDYRKLWRSVDENSGCPIIPVIDEIREVQELVILSSSVTEGRRT